jgi:riboflavin synthase
VFTGIVESTGRIVETRPSPRGIRLRLDAGNIARECQIGDSISVHGACLTAAGVLDDVIDFDIVPETLHRTTLGQKNPGDRLNLERSLRLGDPLDGHLVQGHVDGTAAVVEVEDSSGEHVVWLRPEEEIVPFLIPKGSVTVDGVSLTIASLRDVDFSVALIPTTLKQTTLGELKPGDQVNIETDMIVRTIVHRLEQLPALGTLAANVRFA